MQNGLCGGIGIKSNKIAEIGCVKMLTHPIFLHISDGMSALLKVMVRLSGFIDFRKKGLLISLLYFLGFIGRFELLRKSLICSNFALKITIYCKDT